MKLRRKVYFFVILLAVLFGVRNQMDAEAAAKTTKKQAPKVSYTIYVNRTQNIVNVVDSKTGKLVRAMYCSTGRGYITIPGTFLTQEKYVWHELNGGVYGQYCTRIYGSYLFHSVPYFRPDVTQLETYLYNQLGTQASMGCIRLATVDAKWIYDNCQLRTKVVIGEKKKLKKPKRPLIKVSTKSYAGWDPTDPNPKNPYYPTLKLKKASLIKVKMNSKFKAKSVIKVSSAFTKSNVLLKNVKVSGKVNTKKPGKYKIKYTVTDPATELKKSFVIKFQVVK